MLVNQLKLYYRATFNRVRFWKEYHQVVVESQYYQRPNIEGKANTIEWFVFTTSNSTRKMLDPLLSRFVIIKVEKYSFEEFKQVAMKVLNSGSWMRQ